MSAPVLLRVARSDELDEIVAIDDDACSLYATAGLDIDMGPEHPFAAAERARWQQAAVAGRAFFATTSEGRAIGLLVTGYADGVPHLEQVSVRREAGRRGIGRFLVRWARSWAGAQDLWLTTYAHVPWNRPFYEQEGFSVVPDAQCGPEVRAFLAEQRRWLPHPDKRIAMCARTTQSPVVGLTSTAMREGTAERVFDHRGVRAGAEQQPDRSRLVRLADVAVEGLQVEVELAEVLRLEAIHLELDGAEAVEAAVEEEEVDGEISVADLDGVLGADVAEVAAQLDEEVLQPQHQGAMQIAFGVLGWEVEELDDVRVL